MIMQEDKIVDIPAERIKFFGGPGKMLLPCPATIAAVIMSIPEQQLMTTNQLTKTLTAQFEVEGTCPITTKNSLKALANDPNQQVAYWRVIKSSGGLFSSFPGGVDGHAARLEQEGCTIDTHGKAPKVKDFGQRLARFA
ncbi:hypothetical protein KDA_42400 [Dictyobacter alpinus]|uniref:Uncharacterized protein n=1 Tax=Dictyobacter alpinus TaxID=2014873 RepID=A0A402BBR2_9CHLR|nr:MGMT family protein [Dictyobacter alpinus]GCE28756.1 hypothetical protein KDA_42400 [Dictyobacter alpinus]